MMIRFKKKSKARGEYEKMEIEGDEKTYTVRRKKKPKRYIIEHRLKEGESMYGYPHHDWVEFRDYPTIEDARRAKEKFERHWIWGKFDYRILD